MTTNLHPFEKAGLGQSPFTYEGMNDNARVVGDAVLAGGTCDYCGTGIRYECLIRSNDGRRFKVGCDCVRKIGREDNALLTAVERDEAKRTAEKRDAERAAKWAKQNAEREARLQAERDRNGGLTDWEMAENERAARDAENETKCLAENDWLLSVLANAYQGDFVQSICRSLRTNIAADAIGGRAYEIVADIYAKTKGGRSGSKAYKAAKQEFYDRLPE